MAAAANSKVLILGGVGFIGRNLVKYLVDNRLAAKIRVADKAHPGSSNMLDEHKAAFDQKDIVQYVQCDLSKDQGVAKAFADEQFDFVVNLCGETRFGMSDDEYKKKCLDPALKCGAAALAAGVSKFVEVSTAHIYKSDDDASKESDKIDPWTVQASNRLAAEQGLQKLGGLPLVILRPAITYGPGDASGIMPRLACAASYKKLNEKMKFLWSSDLKINVVHVLDVCRAIWMAATELPSGSIHNLADKSNLDQGDLNNIIEKIFKIDTGFQGYIVSNLAQMALDSVAEQANDKHMEPWQLLCKEHSIETQLSPYIDKELLKKNHLCVDGAKITKDKNFQYTHPKITEALVREQLTKFVDQKQFPPII
jgi:nucleoside-diphosphate-sugar epimerase